MVAFVGPSSAVFASQSLALGRRRARARVCCMRKYDNASSVGENARSVERVKLIHWTDVHFHSISNSVLNGKQLLGIANLYVFGRAEDFASEELVTGLGEAMRKLNPDIAVFSGDITALGTDEEFEKARRVVEPLLREHPTIMIAGNHDRYTKGGRLSMEKYFGDWMRGGRQNGVVWEREESSAQSGSQDGHPWPAVFETESGLKLIALDQARPSMISNGEHSKGQLTRLRNLLREQEASQCLVVGHYPIYDPWLEIDGEEERRDGGIPLYNRFGRSLKDVNELHAALLASPPLAYLCGHHHASRVVRGPKRESSRRSILQICCGNSAYVGRKASNRAGFYEIDVDVCGAHTRITKITRHAWNADTRSFDMEKCTVPANLLVPPQVLVGQKMS